MNEYTRAPESVSCSIFPFVAGLFPSLYAFQVPLYCIAYRNFLSRAEQQCLMYVLRFVLSTHPEIGRPLVWYYLSIFFFKKKDLFFYLSV